MQNSAVMPKTMSSTEFRQLSEFIFDLCGIKMPSAKKVMLEGRLQKRLKSLGLGSYGEYCEYLLHAPNRESEYAQMIDCVTTNKTDFFREPVHFHFLTETLLPELLKQGTGAGSAKKISIWSAGCSSGEEPYTLAMVLNNFASQYPGFQFSILATDISNRVLEKAALGIYDEEQAACIPLPMKQQYLLRAKNRQKRLVRLAPALRAQVQFRRVNLMDDRIMPRESIDVIFCRNVIIYFNRETQFKIVEKFCDYLKNGGHLFLGHSETVHGFPLPLTRVTSTIYRKDM